MADEKVKVLYITGTGRSGSTILCDLLGQMPGVFPAGELYQIWYHGRSELERLALCACGLPHSRCQIWKDIFTSAFQGNGEFDRDRMYGLCTKYDRTRQLWRFRNSRAKCSPGLQEYIDCTAKVCRAIKRVSKARLIVDASKLPSHGYVLQLSDAIDLYVVELIRDSRAVAYSWQRKKIDASQPGGLMRRRSPVAVSWGWASAHLACGVLWRDLQGHYLKVRYEDFVKNPKAVVSRILKMVGEEGPHLPFLSEHQFEKRPVHSFAGNPGRYRNGLVELRPDEEWKTDMKMSHRLLVTMLTAPLLVRNGYRLNPF